MQSLSRMVIRVIHIILGVPVYHTDNKEYYPVEVQIRSLTMDLWASMEHRIIYINRKT